MKNSNLESFPTHSISYSFGLSVQDMNTARAGDKDITVCIHRKAYISSERGKKAAEESSTASTMMNGIRKRTETSRLTSLPVT